jgi:hypothetical protein
MARRPCRSRQQCHRTFRWELAKMTSITIATALAWAPPWPRWPWPWHRRRPPRRPPAGRRRPSQTLDLSITRASWSACRRR